MGIQEYPLINGQMVSWAEIAIPLEIYDAASFKTADFASIDFSDKLEGAKVRGTGPRVQGRTVGEYDADGSISMYYDKYIAFQAALNAIKPNQIGLVPFDIPVSWTPLDGIGTVHTAKLVACRIAGRGVSASPGPDAIVVTLPLSIMHLELDGVRLI